MCRMLAVAARRSATLSEHLGPDLARFTALSDEHRDGYGLAWWQETGPDIVKSSRPPSDGSSGFDLAVRSVSSDAFLLHFRLASPGIPVTEANNHPFRSATMAFAHNGEFTPPTAVDDLIAASLLADAHGTTDSERFFLLVRSLLPQIGSPAVALQTAAREVVGRAPFISLNCLLLTHDAIHAYAHHAPDRLRTMPRDPDFFDVRYRVDDGHVVVASTGWQPLAQDWQVVPQQHVLSVDRRTLTTTLTGPPGAASR